jgi:hypothetical protein
MKRRLALALGVAGVATGAGVALLGSDGTLSPDTVTAARPQADLAASGGVLAKAKLESPQAYRAARDAGAKIAATPDGRSFYVQSPATGRGGKTIVTFHGYLSTAFDIFGAWLPEARKRGYRVIAIQWRLGKTKNDSYAPPGMYAQARALLRRAGVPAGQALLHGYSSAAGRTYGVAAIDRRSSRLFSLFVADAGGARKGFPMYDSVFGAPGGRQTLAGTRWVMFCGGRDPDPELTGCPIMRSTRAKVRARGGSVARFIVDPRATHNGFLHNPANTRVALDLFATL